MVRGRDACWEHCVLVDSTKQKVRCNYCYREFSGGVYRMKFHLARIKNKDVVPCTEVPNNVREHIQNILITPKKQKTPKKPKAERAANGQQNSSSASGGLHPNHGSSGQNGSTCPLLFQQPSPYTEAVEDDPQKLKTDLADKKIAAFFFQNSIPFNAAKSMCYQEMIDAIVDCGAGYKAPSYGDLRTTLLDEVKKDIHDRYKKHIDDWKQTGCTILCEKSWSDSSSKSIIVFSVMCTKGTIFLKSVDISGHEDDATYLYELLESIVLEVGVEAVIQVITDSSACYVYAGRLLMTKYNSLFWSPCASNCIDKVLEDISKQDWVSKVLEEAMNITRYIYSHEWTLNMIRKYTGGREILRPRLTRLVSNYLSLREIVIQEDNLKHMFSHPEWLSSTYSRRCDAQAVKSLLFEDRFWKSAHEAVNVSDPLVKILRIVDGDMPAMGYVQEGLERAKISIKTYYKGIEEKYMPIWDVIERRCNVQLHSPLHAAAAFLNPSVFYNVSGKIDARMRNGFQDAMMKMATTEMDKVEITKEHPMYINAQGALSTDFAIMGRTLNSPGDWWASYGYEIPTLQKVALKILSQPCSLHWCMWNWNTFKNLHNKIRNKGETEKLNDLVFVHCNLWLQGLCQSRDGRSKCIVYDEIDVTSEWPTEIESSNPVLDDSWLDNLHLVCE